MPLAVSKTPLYQERSSEFMSPVFGASGVSAHFGDVLFAVNAFRGFCFFRICRSGWMYSESSVRSGVSAWFSCPTWTSQASDDRRRMEAMPDNDSRKESR